MIHDPIYPHTPGHRGVDTSMEAADAMASITGNVRTAAHNAIVAAGSDGLTCEELANATGYERGTIQPRTTELKLMHRIKDSGQRRKNKNGKRAIVWVALTVDERAALVANHPVLLAEKGSANA
jgi:hypothetical protein